MRRAFLSYVLSRCITDARALWKLTRGSSIASIWSMFRTFLNTLLCGMSRLKLADNVEALAVQAAHCLTNLPVNQCLNQAYVHTVMKLSLPALLADKRLRALLKEPWYCLPEHFRVIGNFSRSFFRCNRNSTNLELRSNVALGKITVLGWIGCLLAIMLICSTQ
jgi:hypothetical protein